MTEAELIQALSETGLLAPPSGPAPISLLFFELMADAEAQYGSRDTSWLFAGITYRSTGAPMTIVHKGGRKVTAIALTADAMTDVWLRRWQLAHEVVHLLSPPLTDETTFLEEGVASYNQFRHSNRGFTGDNLFSNSPLRYQDAFDVVRRIVTADPCGIRNLRGICMSLSQATSSMIRHHFPSASQADADFLSSKFYV